MSQGIMRGLTAEAADIVGDIRNHSIHERLKVCLSDRHTGNEKRLAKALSTAADQLEYLTPSVFAATSKGLGTGAVAHVQRGTILILLAEGSRCMTSHMEMPNVLPAFDQLIDLAKQNDITVHPALITSAMVEKWGELPGKKPTRGSPSGTQVGIALGALLGAIPPEGRAQLAHAITHIRDSDVCPALIGLVGPSSSGEKNTISFVWPLLIPVAEYIEVFTERHEHLH
jgi:hypothetical protein